MKKDELLEKEIESLKEYLGQLDPSDQRYIDTVNALEKLNRMKPTPWWKMDKDLLNTLIVVFGNFAVVAMTLNWEQIHTLTSDALKMTVKPKI